MKFFCDNFSSFNIFLSFVFYSSPFLFNVFHFWFLFFFCLIYCTSFYNLFYLLFLFCWHSSFLFIYLFYRFIVYIFEVFSEFFIFIFHFVFCLFFTILVCCRLLNLNKIIYNLIKHNFIRLFYQNNQKCIIYLFPISTNVSFNSKSQGLELRQIYFEFCQIFHDIKISKSKSRFGQKLLLFLPVFLHCLTFLKNFLTITTIL